MKKIKIKVNWEALTYAMLLLMSFAFTILAISLVFQQSPLAAIIMLTLVALYCFYKAFVNVLKEIDNNDKH